MEVLRTIVSRYCKLKNEVDGYKKQIEEDNKNIKVLMKEGGLTKVESEGFTVNYSVAVSESFDEEKLLSKLRSMKFGDKMADEIGLIEYVPKVNMDALENAIYNRQVDPIELADCRIRKETERLTIKKGK